MATSENQPGQSTPIVKRGTGLRRLGLWSFMLALVLSLAAPVAIYYSGTIEQARAAEQASNPRANFWRAVRAGEPGYTSESGPYTTNVLIQNGGQNWRSLRNGPVASISPWLLALVLLAIGLFHFIHGPQRIEGSLSGRKVPRWSFSERVLHWYVATLFIVLAITGLSMFFGRAVLIPVIGIHANAAWADFSKILHNYLGPFFVVGVLLEVIAWMRFNLFTKHDMDWLKSLGGTLDSSKHPHAGRTNGGEKVWFWVIATLGLIGVCVTGLIMDFPNFGQSRETMQLSNILHSIFALIWIMIALGHIYLGVWGTPGAMEGMTTGEVSEEWMKKHHDLWYDDMVAKGEASTASSESETSPRGSPG
jgi:formate dehydrogenase subunit gamma